MEELEEAFCSFGCSISVQQRAKLRETFPDLAAARPFIYQLLYLYPYAGIYLTAYCLCCGRCASSIDRCSLSKAMWLFRRRYYAWALGGLGGWDQWWCRGVPAASNNTSSGASTKNEVQTTKARLSGRHL